MLGPIPLVELLHWDCSTCLIEPGVAQWASKVCSPQGDGATRGQASVNRAPQAETRHQTGLCSNPPLAIAIASLEIPLWIWRH